MAQHELPFDSHHAFIIGINAYPTHPLISARNDAEMMAGILQGLAADNAEESSSERSNTFQVHTLLLDEEATKENIEKLIAETIPAVVGEKDRLLFYFAGHGIALDNHDVENEGPKGFLVPVDGEITDGSTMVNMDFLRTQMESSWKGKHGLVVLDCCFSGAFQWSTVTRNFRRRSTKKVYDRRFTRYTTDDAWQVLTSASSDEEAVDVVSRLLGSRGEGNNSPFARALKEGLEGAADFGVLEGEKDGVITVTELFVYVRDRVKELTKNSRIKQTPDLLELKRHTKGEYMFINPDPRIPFNLPPLPDRNPYQGLQTFEEEDAEFFYGREQVIEELEEKVEEQPLVVITAGSGMGKSSLVKAGLLPKLRASKRLSKLENEEAEDWDFVVVRPEQEVIQALSLPEVQEEDSTDESAAFVKSERLLALETQKSILIIDQYEQALMHGVTSEQYLNFDRALASLMAAEQQRIDAGEESRFRLILTIRSDYELLLHGADHPLSHWWKASRYVVPPLSWENLFDIVTLPAQQSILFFEPEDFPAKLVTEVDQQPGALPLLSLTLNSLYNKLIDDDRADRKLLESDYLDMDGLIGVVSARADAVFESLGEEEKGAEKQEMMKHIILRMVKIENGKLVRRKVPFLLPGVEKPATSVKSSASEGDIPKIFNELDFEEDEDDVLVHAVRERLEAEQLIIVPPPDQETNQSYLEPMHDALINFWPRCLRWVQEFGPSNIVLQRLLWSAVMDYLSRKDGRPEDVFIDEIVRASFLWDRNPKLDQLEAILQSPDNWMNKAETDFVRKSLDKRNSIVAQLKKERDEARSSALAAKGLLLYPDNNTLGYNLAVHAYEKARSNDALSTILETSARRSLFYKRYFGHDEAITSIAYLSDGQGFVTASNDATIKLWKRAGELQHTFKGHRLKILDLSISADDQWLVTASHDRTIRIWDLEDTDKNPVVLEEHQGPVTSICFSRVPISLDADDEPTFKFVSGSTDNRVVLWDVEGNKLKEYSRDDVHQVWSVAFSPDGQEILAGTGNKKILLWNLLGEVIREFVQDGHHAIVSAVAMHGSKDFVLSGGAGAQGGEENKMLLWENTGDSAKVYQVLDQCEGAITDVTFLKQRDQMAMTCQDGNIYIGNVIDYDPRRLGARGQAMMAVDFHPEGRNLLVGDQKGGYLIYDLRGALMERCLDFGFGISPALFVPPSFSPNDFDLKQEALFIGGKEGQGLLLNLANRARTVIAQHAQSIRVAAFSSNKRFLVTGGMDGKVKRLNFHGEPQLDLELDGIIEGVAVSSDGQRVFAANRSPKITIWNNAVDPPAEHPVSHEVLAIALSADDKYLLIGGSGGKVMYWNMETNQETELKGHGSMHDIHSVAISPNGDQLLTGGGDGQAILWDKQGIKIKEIEKHPGAVRCVRFSGDGRFILVTGENGVVLICDSDGNRLQELEDNLTQVWSGDFSSDGRYVATKSVDGIVRLWRNYFALREMEWMEQLTEEEQILFGVQEPVLMSE